MKLAREIRMLLLIGLPLFLTSCVFYSTRPPKSLEYTVRQGETLSEIGQRFMVSSSELQRANDISDARSLRAGQRITIPFTASPKKKDTESIRASLKRSDQKTRTIRLTSSAHYIGNLGWPAQSKKLNSNFGWRRGRFHEGIDIKARSGERISAAHAGTVVYSGSMRGYGKVVVVRGQNIMTVYAHNRRNRADVGEAVEQGDWIADTGQSGRVSGPHLHFEVRVPDKNGRNVAVDPLVFFPGR